jgi:hypothetical protein
VNFQILRGQNFILKFVYTSFRSGKHAQIHVCNSIAEDLAELCCFTPFPLTAKLHKYDACAILLVQHSKLVAAASVVLLASAPDQAAVARLTAVSAPHAGAFLHNIPMTATGTNTSDHSLHIAVSMRLGTSVCAEQRCLRGAMVDVNGIHRLCCRISKGRLACHNAVNELVKRALLTAEIPSRLEPTKLSHTDDKRSDGVSTMTWSREQDFTSPDTLAVSHLNKAVNGPGHVVNDPEQRKRDKYAALSTEYHAVCADSD